MADQSPAPARTPTAKTPIRRAVSAEPSTATRPSFTTPTARSSARQQPLARSQQRYGGLSASGRKHLQAATPHGREAIRTLDLRRAAVLTPHHHDRRRSAREQRETPRDVLRGLSRLLAPGTRPVKSSSSPRDDAGAQGSRRGDEEDDDDLPIDRPRLSLPIDEDDDDSELQPPRSAGLEDENYTVQSVEMPRRALSEQPGLRRLSAGDVRMSDFFGRGEGLEGEDVGVDSMYFPPVIPMEDDGGDFGGADEAFERLDSEIGRLAGVRESDFGVIDVPFDGNDTTVVLAPQLADSPDRRDDTVPGMDSVPELESEEDEDNERDLTGQVDQEDPTTTRQEAHTAKRRKRGIKLSRHGHEYPSLPPAVVKRLAQTFAQSSGIKAKISSDTVTSLMQASDWFFEQISDDLAAYAKHAGRKTIDESDMITLMKRQRQTSSSSTPFALAQRYLPRELLQELRMPVPKPTSRRRKGGDFDTTEDLT